MPPRTATRATIWPLLYLSVALTTSATLVLAVALSRIFAVVFHFPLAFLTTTVAMLGLGAGGVISLWVRGSERCFERLGVISLVTAALALVSIIGVVAQGGEMSTSNVALICLTSAMPFAGSGLIVSLAISQGIERIENAWAFGLLGCGAGCLGVVGLLNAIGAPNTVIAVSVLYSAAAAIWFSMGGRRRGRVGSVAVALCFTLVVIANMGYRFIEVKYAKGRELRGEMFAKWNSVARISVTRDGAGGDVIRIDGSGSSAIANFDFDHLRPEQRDRLLKQGPGVPYVLRPGAKTLILEPGGGMDVARALASGSRDITGVEINPSIARAVMQRKFPNLSNRLYLRPEVRIEVEDGRSFVRRSAARYRVIQITKADLPGTLTESSLYTTDAFRDYFSHLTDDGILALTVPGSDPARESLRLVSLAVAVVRESGEKHPATHVLVGRDASADTVIISRRPLAESDIAMAGQAFRDAGMRVMYAPGAAADNAFGQMLRARDLRAWQAGYAFDVTAVDDDHPYFFRVSGPRTLREFLLRRGGSTRDDAALPKLFMAVCAGLAAVMLIMILSAPLHADRNALASLPWFVAIGMGYVMIVVAMIQKFQLFLGHPTYGLTVVLLSTLMFGAAGSWVSRGLIGDSVPRLRMALGAVAGLVAVMALIVHPALGGGAGLSLQLKMMATAALLAPATFAMGIPVPVGFRWLGRQSGNAVRLAWSLGATAAVLGSAVALVLAVYLGLSATMLAGSGMFVVAMLMARRSQP